MRGHAVARRPDRDAVGRVRTDILDGGRIHPVGADSVTTETGLRRKKTRKEDLMVLPPLRKIMETHNA